MLKRLFIFSALFFFSIKMFSQTIPNSDFENWSTGSGPFPTPTGWAINPVVVQSATAHSGSWALLCKNDTLYNPMNMSLDTMPGHAYTGTQTMGPPPSPGTPFGGYPFTQRPDSLTGWTMFAPLGTDTARINVMLSKWNTGTSSRDVIGSAQIIISAASCNYQRFAVPINYQSTNTSDTAIIDITTGGMGVPFAIGTKLWVDDLAFTSISSGLAELATSNLQYNNPFGNTLIIKSKSTLPITLFDVKGSLIAKGTTNQVFRTSDWSNGIYIAQITDLKSGTKSSIKLERCTE